MAPAVGFIGGMFGIGAGAAFGAAGGAAFGGWVAGAAFAGTLLGSLTVNLLGTVALSALSRALAPEPEQGGGITISSTVAGETNPETIILGRYATGGQALCPPYSHGSSNRYLNHVIELCSAPGAQLDRIMLGDEWVELGANGLSEYGRPVLGDKYGGHVWVKYLDGSQTAADPMLRAKYGNHPERPWTADMVGRGLCLGILTFYYDQEVLAQIPRYRFELTGIPVYDIRKDSGAGGVGPQRLDDPSTWAVSHNPIVLAWNIMRGIALPGGDVYGGNIRDLRRLPQAVWIAAMNRCDVPAEGADGPEPMYRAGLEVLLTQPPATAIEELFKSCSAVFADLGYGYGVTVGGPALPVYSITDDDIIVSAPEERDPFPGLQDSWNAATAKYPDPAHFWETRESPQFTNAEYEAADTFGRRMATLSLPAAPYPAQVQRMLGPWLEDERRDLRHNITVPPDSAHVELIDTLLWTSDHNLYDARAFTIHEIVEDPFTGVRQMAIREVDPADWVPRPDYLMPSPPAPTPPALIPATVDGYDVQPVSMVDGASKARRAGIRILWSPDLAGLGLRWRVRLAGQTEPVLHGTTQALRDGYVDLYEGVLPVTDYQVQAELITDRPTVPTAWLPVTTDDVRLSLDDLTAEVAGLVADMQAWLDGYPAEREDIDEAIQAVHDQAMAALGVAQDYLEAGIEAESTARQAGLEALAAQVQTLTAVLNSTNYLTNPRFVDGGDGWGLVTADLEVVDRDPLSSDPIVATAPTSRFAWLGPADTSADAIQQVFDFETDPGEVAQWRVWLTSTGPIPVTVRMFWLDADGLEVGTAHTSITVVPDEWQVFSAQKPPPEGATRMRWNILRSSTAATTGATDRLAIADASVTKVDVSLLARITDLEVVVANAEAATTLWQNTANTRMGANDASIAAETLARSDADAALASRAAALETTSGEHGTRLGTVETAVSTATGALADLTTRVEASGGLVDLVSDGVFARGFADWPLSANGGFYASTRVIDRNLAGTPSLSGMPALRAIRLLPADTSLPRPMIATAWQPVMRGEEIALLYDYYRTSSGVYPRLVLRFRDTTGTVRTGWTHVLPGTRTGWNSISMRQIVPAEAAEAQVYISADDDTKTTLAHVTNIRAPRGQELYASGVAKITSEVTSNGAMATLGFGVRAGLVDTSHGEAAFYMRAYSSGASEVLWQASGLYLFDGSNETVPFAYVGGELYLAARVTAEYLTIDKRLDISGTGALAAVKKTPTDAADGLFFGNDGSGNFAFTASRTHSSGRKQSLSLRPTGFTFTNPTFKYAMSAPAAVVRRTTNLAITTLTGAKMIQIPSAIGGGGGGAGSSGQLGTNGTATVIELYDGSTLKKTITAAGGATGGYSRTGAGEPGLNPGNRGGGGGGGNSLPEDGPRRIGRGGKAGSIINEPWIDVSSWTTPRIKITIGAGGAGGVTTSGSNGTAGIAGEASYQILTAAEVSAGMLPHAPTATGSFVTSANTSGSLPSLGPGYWVLMCTSGTLDMGNITAATGGLVRTNNLPTVSFPSNRAAPPYSGGPSGRTIYYLFYSMEPFE